MDQLQRHRFINGASKGLLNSGFKNLAAIDHGFYVRGTARKDGFSRRLTQ
jgi:hypothetical protein